MDPDQAPAPSDPAAAPVASAPAVATPSPAPAPAAATPAAAPAEPTTLLTAAPAAAAPVAAAPPADPPKEGEETDEQKAAKAAAAADEHAPEAYAAFELPESIKQDDDTFTAFKDVAKELDLSQGKAQKIAALIPKVQERFITDLQATVTRNAQEWEASVKRDPELGGTQHEEVMGTAAKALAAFGTPEFKQFLNETRLGSHPEMVRLLYKAGKNISQDSTIPGRSASPAKTDANVFYPSKE